MKGNINMKLRKILCLSLAAAVTFTSAINLTVSAEIGGENANENQSFGCIILDKMRNEKSDNDNSGISPLWTGDTHDEIIMGGDSNYIPAAYSDLVYKICKWCDDDSKIPFATCLHGNQNYVASLKFLWKFAQVIGDNSLTGTYNKLSSDAKKAALEQFDEKYIKRVNPYGNYTQLVKLADTTEYLINNYGKHKTPEGRKYLVYGFIMHLLGDVTAHRTVVPKAMVTNAVATYNSNKPNCLGKNHFTAANWSTVTSKINIGGLDFTTLTSYIKDKNVSYYEDNPDCYYNRVLFSETMVNYFLHYFNKSFDDSIFDPIYSNVNLISLSGYKNNITQS